MQPLTVEEGASGNISSTLVKLAAADGFLSVFALVEYVINGAN
jgi:hypothetical protein